MLNMLEVNHLRVWDANEGKEIIRDSSFRLKPQTCLAIVGKAGAENPLRADRSSDCISPGFVNPGDSVQRREFESTFG